MAVVRPAEERDREQVLRLFDALIEELAPMGGHLRAGPRTSAWVEAALEAALEKRGACFVAEAGEALVAVSLACAAELPFDTAFGSAALGIGTYVAPAHRKNGLADLLYGSMAAVLSARGFTTYLAGFLLGNERSGRALARAGFVPYEASLVMPLVGAEVG